MTVSCLDCNASWTVDEAEAAGGLQDGSVRERVGAYGTKTYFGICDTCQNKHKRASKPTTEDEFVRLRRTMAANRKSHPEWSLAECSAETVKALNDPWRERDPGFRAYLLEHDA